MSVNVTVPTRAPARSRIDGRRGRTAAGGGGDGGAAARRGCASAWRGGVTRLAARDVVGGERAERMRNARRGVQNESSIVHASHARSPLRRAAVTRASASSAVSPVADRWPILRPARAPRFP